MSKKPDKQVEEDFEFLSNFVLGALKTGKIDVLQAFKAGQPLKRQAGKIDQAIGHIVRRYANEDEKAATMIGLAAQQSSAFRNLAERWGLMAKEVEVEATDVEVKEAKRC